MTGAEFLAKVPVFGVLDPSSRAELARELKPGRYEKEAVIVSKEDKGTALYLIAKGKVKVSIFSASGREVILSMMAAGEFFGEQIPLAAMLWK